MSAGQPMKRAELIEAAVCLPCGRVLGKTELPFLFYRVTIERHGIKRDAVERHHGLELLTGHPAIAAAFSPDEDMTVVLLPPVTFTVCEDCSINRQPCVAELAERAGGKS